MARALYGPGTDRADVWARQRKDELDAGRLRAIVAELRSHTETTDAARRCLDYVVRNRRRMRCPRFRAQGLCVSSGVVEAGCKQVVGARLQRAGMRWTVAGANAVIALAAAGSVAASKTSGSDEPPALPDGPHKSDVHPPAPPALTRWPSA